MTARAVEMRAASLRAGLRGSVLLCTAVGAWALTTIDRPHRLALFALVAFFALVAAVLARMPAERITRHRHADKLYAAWSLLAITGISLGVAVEDGLSPLALTYVMPLIFAALAYPLRMVVVVALVDALACASTLGLTTDIDPADLGLATTLLVIAAYLCTIHAQAHARSVAESDRLSRTDVLTGTLNRRGFDAELAARVARQQRHDTPFGLVLFDLDAFKEVNDRHGHAVGDELLQRMAAAAVDAVRVTDAVARIGGDEFAVLLDSTDAEMTEAAAARLSARLTELGAVSVGWAACPDDAGDGDDLYRQADARLYGHKNRPGGSLRAVVADAA